jgi:hypothetical protein
VIEEGANAIKEGANAIKEGANAIALGNEWVLRGSSLLSDIAGLESRVSVVIY